VNQRNHIQRLQYAREWRDQANVEYEQAIMAAANAGMTHAEIAEALEISRPAVSMYLRDRQPRKTKGRPPRRP